MRYDRTFKYYIIYLLTNKINGKMYVGQHGTDNLKDGYMGCGVAIRKAIKEYGKENFSKEILCYCADRKDACQKEIEYIEKLGTTRDGYNITKGGEGMLGHSHTAESRLRIASSKKRFYQEHPEAKDILRRPRFGESNPFFGHKLSVEHIALLTKARIAAITGNNNPSAKKVVCIETGEVFGTAKAGAQKMGKRNDPSQIIKVCRGRLKTAHGYHWKYKV